jgi:glutamate synthase (ferredoxin)
MSGGVAYVLDELKDFRRRCNLQMVDLEWVEDKIEIDELYQMIQRHADYTKSERAWKILALWEEMASKFMKVMPKDYKRALEAMARVQAMGLSGDEAVMAAFEENKKDLSRVGGN